MLIAVGVDANNGIYPVAYGIMESDNQYSWTWFLTCLADDFDLFTNSNFTFIKDKQKGLVPTITKLFPSAKHRFCVRHINENMNLTWKGEDYKEIQLLDARDSPIITSLEYVREYLMKRIVIVQNFIQKSDGPLTPAVTKLFNKIKEAASECTVDWNGSDLFQVKDNGMDVSTPEDWVPESYKLQTWMNVYAHKINSVNGRDMWSKFECLTTLLPPKIAPQIGRPPKKRKKIKDEIAIVKGDKLTRKEPVGSETMASQPLRSQPVASELVSSQHVTRKPVARKHVARKHVQNKSTANKRTASEINQPTTATIAFKDSSSAFLNLSKPVSIRSTTSIRYVQVLHAGEGPAVWGSQEQQTEQRPQEASTSSWYSPFAASSPSSSQPATPNSSSNYNSFTQRPGGQVNTLACVSPAENTGIIVHLQDKSVDELNKLSSDKEAYQEFLLSIDPVKTSNNLRDDLRNETLQLARENLTKESCMTELRNQCMIIRTTELASAHEKLNNLNKHIIEVFKPYSLDSLLHQLQESTNKIDEESETLHKQLLEKEIDVATFIQKHKKLRVEYHKRSLTHLAATTSLSRNSLILLHEKAVKMLQKIFVTAT
ncbi:vacuolar protein sorting-associated protein 37 homolog 1-like protein [Tanacetum coccineum]